MYTVQSFWTIPTFASAHMKLKLVYKRLCKWIKYFNTNIKGYIVRFGHKLYKRNMQIKSYSNLQNTFRMKQIK